MTTSEQEKRIVPALGYRWLTGLYDPVLSLTMRERSFKARLLAQAGIEPGHRVLDLGCGTGTLTVWIKRSVPGAGIRGIDADPAVLERARRKAREAGVAVELDRGLAYELPYEDGGFDRVVSSLLFHHLRPGEKRRALAEALRVLRPGGELHIADWGRGSNGMMRLFAHSIRLLDGAETTTDSLRGALPGLIEEAGFEDVAIRSEIQTVYGTLALISARKPT